MPDHYARLVASDRYVPVERCGRVLFILGRSHGTSRSVSVCRYDRRFVLMPRGWEPPRPPKRPA